MSNLVIEILLRLAKAGIAAWLGIVLYLILVGALGRDRLRPSWRCSAGSAAQPSSCSWSRA